MFTYKCPECQAQAATSPVSIPVQGEITLQCQECCYTGPVSSFERIDATTSDHNKSLVSNDEITTAIAIVQQMQEHIHHLEQENKHKLGMIGERDIQLAQCGASILDLKSTIEECHGALDSAGVVDDGMPLPDRLYAFKAEHKELGKLLDGTMGKLKREQELSASVQIELQQVRQALDRHGSAGTGDMSLVERIALLGYTHSLLDSIGPIDTDCTLVEHDDKLTCVTQIKLEKAQQHVSNLEGHVKRHKDHIGQAHKALDALGILDGLALTKRISILDRAYRSLAASRDRGESQALVTSDRLIEVTRQLENAMARAKESEYREQGQADIISGTHDLLDSAGIAGAGCLPLLERIKLAQNAYQQVHAYWQKETDRVKELLVENADLHESFVAMGSDLERLEAIVSLAKMLATGLVVGQPDTKELLDALMTMLFAHGQNLCTTDQIVQHCQETVSKYREKHGFSKLDHMLE